MGRLMPHKECLFLEPLVAEVKMFEKQNPPPKLVPPQTGPHLEDLRLYPQGSEPYEPVEFTD